MLARVRYIAREMLAHHAMPVGGVLFVEEAFDELSNFLFCLFAVDGLINLRFNIELHFGTHFANGPVQHTFSHFS